jgi:ABC-type bacteriocin/lantibiotic exporter with double-glycine peptidase domain
MINLAVVILVYVGALKVEGGILTQGLVIALYNYMSQILVELIKMATMIITLTKAVACGNRLSDVLDLTSSQVDGSIRNPISGAVSFRNVTAHYENAAQSSLENISFEAMPGQTIGIIGGTGSGKTTLINLIPRLYDAAGGSVLLDGIPVQEYEMNFLRNQSVLFLRKQFFSRALFDRICFGAMKMLPIMISGQLWKWLRAGKWLKTRKGSWMQQ